VESHYSNSVLVVRIGTPRIDAENNRVVKEELRTLVGKARSVILDFSGVSFMDSPGLGAVLACVRMTHDNGGVLSVCCVSRTVKTLFELVRLDRLVKIYETETAALESFDSRHSSD
jgi:anti-sigma B factor antagonist